MSGLHAIFGRMAETDIEGTTLPYAEIQNLNVKAEIVRAGKKYADIEDPSALGLSHAAAMRRLGGKQEWKPSELEAVARWLGIDIANLVRAR